MSLAMYAAPFNNNDYMDKINNDDNPIARKKNANNKTQKRYPKDVNSEKVNTILQTIHNLPPQDDELGDFNTLLPPPISAGVEQTRSKENSKNQNNNEDDMSSYLNPPNEFYKSANTMVDSNANYKSIYSNVNDSSTPSFGNTSDYGRFIPDYSKMYGLGKTENFVASIPKSQNDILLEKLNYMITLLEQQQDDRTSNVTEEVILYSFLGIFIIFIVDSFARVGKYVR
jgi:hypothetical protein